MTGISSHVSKRLVIVIFQSGSLSFLALNGMVLLSIKYKCYKLRVKKS